MKTFFKNLFKRSVFKDGRIEKVGNDGKTKHRMSAIIEYSLENNIPILTGNQDVIDEYLEQSENLILFGFAPNFTKNIKFHDFPNGVLIDESVLIEMVEVLEIEYPHIIIRGGYVKGGIN